MSEREEVKGVTGGALRQKNEKMELLAFQSQPRVGTEMPSPRCAEGLAHMQVGQGISKDALCCFYTASLHSSFDCRSTTRC